MQQISTLIQGQYLTLSACTLNNNESFFFFRTFGMPLSWFLTESVKL